MKNAIFNIILIPDLLYDLLCICKQDITAKQKTQSFKENIQNKLTQRFKMAYLTPIEYILRQYSGVLFIND